MGIEKIVYVTVTLLVIIGALNWGAYALGNNLVEKLGNKNIQNAIYYLIAISGVVSLVFFIRNKGWKKNSEEDYAGPPTKTPMAPMPFLRSLPTTSAPTTSAPTKSAPTKPGCPPCRCPAIPDVCDCENGRIVAPSFSQPQDV